MVDTYRRDGLGSNQILQAFQGGQATTDLRERLDSLLTDDELAAVADVTLLPRRRVSRTNLVTTIAEQAQDADVDERSVAVSLGSPVGFGGQTGNVRGVLAGVRALQLDSAEMSQLADLIGQGQRDAALNSLTQRGIPVAQAQMLLADIAALPSAITLPQTAAPIHSSTTEPNDEAN